MMIDGQAYDGDSGPRNVVPRDGLVTWTSDGSVTRGPWELCVATVGA